MQNADPLQIAASVDDTTLKCDNDHCGVELSKERHSAVSAHCGHVVCKKCFEAMRKSYITKCPSPDCSAAMDKHRLMWNDKIGHLPSNTRAAYGAKTGNAISLLKRIEEQGDQAVLFVQFEEQLAQVGAALEESNISATIIDDTRTAGRRVAEFVCGENGKKTAIVLNASDETAAGLNLQKAANHVIFLSPLLRDQQYVYEGTMTQAIGRVLRPGQEREVHVHRIFAVNTIDVDILELRERRTNALQEQGALKALPRSPLWERTQVDGEPVRERTQLIRKNGRFYLAPKSWLVKCGPESDPEELAKIRGPGYQKERKVRRGRVAGYEDFSSLIKFSRRYTEDDV